jgi:hypothetical protein
MAAVKECSKLTTAAQPATLIHDFSATPSLVLTMTLFLLFLFRFSINLGWMQTPQDLSLCRSALLNINAVEASSVDKITFRFLVNNERPWSFFRLFRRRGTIPHTLLLLRKMTLAFPVSFMLRQGLF